MSKAKMRIVTFLDYGYIGSSNDSANYDTNDISRGGYGAGLEWFSPVGPIQLMFAKPLGEKIVVSAPRGITLIRLLGIPHSLESHIREDSATAIYPSTFFKIIRYTGFFEKIWKSIRLIIELDWLY